jgi:hypothetical protein
MLRAILEKIGSRSEAVASAICRSKGNMRKGLPWLEVLMFPEQMADFLHEPKRFFSHRVVMQSQAPLSFGDQPKEIANPR